MLEKNITQAQNSFIKYYGDSLPSFGMIQEWLGTEIQELDFVLVIQIIMMIMMQNVRVCPAEATAP